MAAEQMRADAARLMDIATPDPRLTTFERDAKVAFAMATWLRRAVLTQALTPDELAWFARETAHMVRPILAVATRICGRCDQPLYAPTERVTGYCTTCLAEFEARR